MKGVLHLSEEPFFGWGLVFLIFISLAPASKYIQHTCNYTETGKCIETIQ